MSHARVSAQCEICGRLFERRPRLSTDKPRFCSRHCANQRFRCRAIPGVRSISVWYQRSRGVWKGEVEFLNGARRCISGTTKAETEYRTHLLATGVPVGRRKNRPGSVDPETVRYALGLLLPLDHIYRLERQQQAITLLESAVAHAELGLEQSPPGPEQVPVREPRSRPAWLEALPKREEAS